ncbi:MAG: hypothetical protein AAB645_01630 [Patescibacteria group bacterium]
MRRSTTVTIGPPMITTNVPLNIHLGIFMATLLSVSSDLKNLETAAIFYGIISYKICQSPI